ncbi:cation:proton antiporter domain-containing protein [Cucumibacter marinus]|uniref:cation:proton antiporter domain-containing protein n=1 Tax=Cucumibacter marinus TaxID=1121252 RepID=UPI0004185423|nr:cation:proton antiporter [Cucumibacter marinus]
MTAEFMLIAFILFAAGVIAVPIATKLGLGSVLGYLIAGIAISPLLSVLGVDVVSIQHFAEFGVVMMLFLVGLELEPRALWAMRMRLMGLGGLQLGLTTVLAMGIAFALGQPWTVALAIGLILSLSSTAIVLQTFNEKGLMRSDGGQSGFSVLLFQDIAVIPMLALMPFLAMPELVEALHHTAGEAASHGEEAGAALSLVDGLEPWQGALVTIGSIGVVLVGGSYLTAPIFRFVSKARLRELFVTTALMIVVGIALLMTLVGLSPALGTFLAGVVMANSEFRHELESDIDPFRGIFLGIFFITIGAAINFALLFDNFLLIAAMTIGLVLLKGGVLYLIGTIFRLPGADRWLFALGLAQAGEFGFVLLSFTVAHGILPTAVSDQLLLVVALSMLLTPGLFIFYDRVIAPKYSQDQQREADEIDSNGSVIIAGHGRVGGIVNRVLRAAGYETTVVDYSTEQLTMLRRYGLKVFFGDATRPDLLEAAGVAKAKVIVIAIDDKQAITELTRHLAKTYPDLHIIARAIDRHHVYDLWSVGCRDIIRETYDSSLRMSRSVLEALSYSRETAEAMIEEFNRVDREAMVELAGLYDINIPMAQNHAYTKRVRELMEERELQMSATMRDLGE